MGIHGRPHFSQRSMEGKEAPADGVITGWGDVDGRPCCIAAYDFTVMAGAMGMTGELKVTRLRETALNKRMPFIWLLDSAGARIQEASGSLFAGSGHLFQEEVVMSGVIPLVAAMMGPCAAGTAWTSPASRTSSRWSRASRDWRRRRRERSSQRRNEVNEGERRTSDRAALRAVSGHEFRAPKPLAIVSAAWVRRTRGRLTPAEGRRPIARSSFVSVYSVAPL